MGVCSWLSIPVPPVIFTLQSFAFLLTLGVLGGRWGTVTVLVYLLLGLMGLPVFAGFRFGPAAFLDPTGGFLWGFLAGAFGYWLLERLGKVPGLPLTWTAGQKESFKAYLTKNKEVSFTWQHKDYKIRIAGASIYPQGYAAVSQFATKMDGVNLVADIGNGTMNVLYVINGRPQSERMYTEKFGTHFCTVDIREAFLRKTQREINEHIIDEVLCKGTANIVQSDMKIIKAEVQKYVAEIFHRLRDHGYDENTMMLYITGGGGCLVKNFYKFNADRIQFIDDICAAAKGYEYLAETMMSMGRI